MMPLFSEDELILTLVPIHQHLKMVDTNGDGVIKPDEHAAFLAIDGGGHGSQFGPKVDTAMKTFLDHHLRGGKKTVKDHTLPATARKK